MATLRWNAGPVELVQNADGELELIKAIPTSDPNYTFGPDQLASLYATMVAQGRNAKCAHLVIYGNEKYEGSNHPAAIPAAVTKVAKKSQKPYNHAYVVAQFKGIEPKGFDLRLSFHKPCLWVYTNDFLTARNSGGGERRRAALTIERVNVEKAEPAKEPAKPAGPRKA